MNDRFERDIREWLAAENDGDDDRADALLAGAFRNVGRRVPGPGFAARVVAAAGFPRRRAWPAWVRVAVLVCLCAAGVTFALLPGVVVAVQPLVRLIAWPFVTALFGWGARVVSAGASFWTVVGDIATATRLALATSTALALVIANVLVAAASLFGLKRLLAGRQEFVEC